MTLKRRHRMEQVLSVSAGQASQIHSTAVQLAAISASTNVACVRATGRVRKTVFYPPANHLKHQWMQTERRRDEVAYAWMVSRGLGCQFRNILAPVPTGQQKIGKDDDDAGAAFHTTSERRGYRTPRVPLECRRRRGVPGWPSWPQEEWRPTTPCVGSPESR